MISLYAPNFILEKISTKSKLFQILIVIWIKSQPLKTSMANNGIGERPELRVESNGKTSLMKGI